MSSTPSSERLLYSGKITGVRFNIGDTVVRNEEISSWDLFTGRTKPFEQFEQIEQSEQDTLEKQKWFIRLINTVDTDPPYGALNATEREDVDLIVQNTNASTYAAAKAFIRSSGDIVDAIMSLSD